MRACLSVREFLCTFRSIRMTLMIYVASGFIELSAKSKSSAKRFLLLYFIEPLQSGSLAERQFYYTALILLVVRYLPMP